jgi:hypothetical protein
MLECVCVFIKSTEYQIQTSIVYIFIFVKSQIHCSRVVGMGIDLSHCFLFCHFDSMLPYAAHLANAKPNARTLKADRVQMVSMVEMLDVSATGHTTCDHHDTPRSTYYFV